LGLGSYQTAWAWLHKLRRAMVRPNRERLQGIVEVDESYLGSVDAGKMGREPGDKALLAIAVELREEGLGRIRLKRIADASAESLGQFIHESIEAGAVLRTDGWRGYWPIAKQGYVHEPTKRKDAAQEEELLLPAAHRVAALLKRWLLGTHQGAVRAEHLDYYLDEFTFRFNRRTSQSRGKLFYRLVEQAVQVEPCPYQSLIHPKP